MKERMRRILCCMGTAGVMTVMMAVPAMAADITEDDQNIEVVQEAEQTVDEADVQDESEVQEETEVQEEAQAEDAQDSSWSDKVAANVLTYANIREGADVSSQCIGRLPSGAVATVVGNDEGWLQVTSGEVNGYIREDLVVSGDEARNLYEAMYGAGDISAEAVTVDAEAAAAEAAAQASQVSAEAVQPEQGQAAEETEADSSQAAAQEVSVSTSDLDLMAAIIECEAGGESYEGKVGVGAVIMNRIRSGEFPNTLSEVIYQSGQFEPTWTGKLSNVLSRGASEACYSAAQDVFAGANTIGDRLFFHAGGGSGLTIGNQTFY